MSATTPSEARLGALLTSPWTLALVVWLAFFWQLGGPPLYDLDEGAFTEATREMLATGNWITPHKDGEPRYDKPVLIYWLQAASVAALGLSEFALRLPSAIAATFWLVALWTFVREHLDAFTAGVAALAMALSLEIGIIGKAAVADAVLNLFIALAFFDAYRWWNHPRRAVLLRVYLWLGLGFLTKGPVAVFFPFAVTLLYALSYGQPRRWLAAVFAPWGWLVFLLVAAPWYIAVYVDTGGAFFESFFLKHNLGRYGGVIHSHAGFPGYYLVALPLVVLPFTGWLLRLLGLGRALWADPLDRFLLLWFLVVFVFFSFSSTKLPHYMVYGITPLFILMARHRAALESRWLALLPPLLFLVLLALLPLLLWPIAGLAERSHEQAMWDAAADVLDWPYRLAMLAALLVWIGLWRWRGAACWQRLIVLGVVQTLVVSGMLMPRVLDVMQAPVKEAGQIARSLDLPTVVYRTSMPSFSVYRQAVTPARPPRPGDLVFLRIDKLRALQRQLPQADLATVYERGPVMLVKVGHD
jgi:4-amino-4-deoxy-L-arabinose transferase-like glycosyltransferase